MSDSNLPGRPTLRSTRYSNVSPGPTVMTSWCFELKQQLSPHPSPRPMICLGTFAGLLMGTTSS
jgi:hypothetical protein